VLLVASLLRIYRIVADLARRRVAAFPGGTLCAVDKLTVITAVAATVRQTSLRQNIMKQCLYAVLICNNVIVF